MACFDLHLHSCWSYDALTPVETYFRFARESGARALAITDHHVMDGYGDVRDAAAKFPEVGFIVGAELTVHCEDGNYDLVCLGLPMRPEGELGRVLELYHIWQREYGSAISRNFCSRGMAFGDGERLELLKTYRPLRAVELQGATHVKMAVLREYCIRHGFCKDEAGYRELRASFSDLPPYPAADAVVAAVKQAGGVVILAHPAGYFDGADRKRMDMLRERFRLDGIECAHPSIPEELTEVYRNYCREHGLLSSGGSDLHSPRREEFAAHAGEEAWLDEILERVTLRHGGDTATTDDKGL